MKQVKDYLILPLDTKTVDDALKLVDELRQYVSIFKVGLELFSNVGPQIISRLHKEGVPVFFDGKFLDIPNTVYMATEAIVANGVYMFNVHATGGSEMLKAAIQARDATWTGNAKPITLAVTVLTSLNQKMLTDELGVNFDCSQQVCRLALLAKNCGVDGVIASASELKALRTTCGQDFIIVTPGVRPNWANKNDQVRVATPCQAILDGADYLVIGRPITGADNKVDAAKRIIEEIEKVIQQ